MAALAAGLAKAKWNPKYFQNFYTVLKIFAV
jgi:hypothetical protein